MTATDARPVTHWWDAQPNPVRALLDLANLADAGQRDRILSLLPLKPEARNDVTNLGDTLSMIERLGWDAPSAALSDWYGCRCIADDTHADELAAELRADVLVTAQLIASVLTLRVAS